MYIENKIQKKYIYYWLILSFLLVSLMIAVGGLTRLTDSGLSITKWELFSGIFPPIDNNDWNNYFNLYKETSEYRYQNYLMSIDEFKVIFWWEWAHRNLGRLIGVFYLVPLIYFTFKVGFKKIINLYSILFLICFQGFMGWYMVTSGLTDRVDVSHFRLSVHLLFAFIILSLILWNIFHLKVQTEKIIKKSYLMSLFFLIIIFLQIIIGAFVSGMDAGKIYNSWPLMGSSYYPDDNNFLNFFKLSAFSEPSLVQFMHRNLAYLILFIYFILFLNIYMKKLYYFYNIINSIGILLLIQIILGISTLLTGAHIFLASMHQISSIFLVSLSVYFFFLNRKEKKSKTYFAG